MIPEQDAWSGNSKLAAWSLLLVLSGCGGGGGGASMSGSSSGGASSGGGSSGAGTLFQQPSEAGISGNLVVPQATGGSPVPKTQFVLVLWQANPDTSSGLLVPTAWNAGSLTGFSPTDPSTAQLGFQASAGTSTAQMEGGTVGAYIDSADLPNSPVGQKMMIAPEYQFAPGAGAAIFAASGAVLGGSLDLQVPTATGDDTYVNLDLFFIDPNGIRLNYGVKLFHLNDANPAVDTSYDTPTNSYAVDSPLGIDTRFVSLATGSATWQNAPWLGFQHYAWTINGPQFAAALQFLAASYPTVKISTDPAVYQLQEVHLNAEFHFNPNPATLGWSMKALTLSVSD